MKKIIALSLIATLVVPFLAGCGEKTEAVDSSKPVNVDSAAAGKKGAAENDKGLRN
ncbi:MAG: hypothetical protein IT363_10975 [Methanoregulaceae archaeon]|jgi:hypothetical protein|nr:hypothetical protein [Methanoregulaceae archaeon]